MDYLLLYKGNYGRVLRGAEMRYASLARELVAMGHRVTLCGRSGGEAVATGVEFVPAGRFPRLVQSFFRSDTIVLHGGGPLVLLVALFASLFKKKLVLDAYVPHWVELEALAEQGGRFSRLLCLTNAYFNSLRCLLGCLVFDRVLVANKRQLDLVRGFMSPFLLTKSYQNISILPYGCEELSIVSRENARRRMAENIRQIIGDDDFLVGWLGGAYGWFNLEHLVRLVAPAIEKNKNLKFVFFGIDPCRQSELRAQLPADLQSNLLFLPWIDFTERFNYWAGLDLSLVWGSERGYENDYASRTRNFDCLALGLPIVQNYDDEWGPRLIDSGGGLIANEKTLSDDIHHLSISPGAIE